MKWLRNVNLGLATRWRSSTPLNLRDCWPITAQKPWAGVSVRWEEWGWGGRLTTLYAVHTVTWPLVGAFPQYGGGSSCSDGLLLTFEYVVRVVTWRGILTDETFQRTWKNKERKKKTGRQNKNNFTVVFSQHGGPRRRFGDFTQRGEGPAGGVGARAFRR